ncbi:MAG: alpha/beta hydrolase [Planctomycetales bacterium]
MNSLPRLLLPAFLACASFGIATAAEKPVLKVWPDGPPKVGPVLDAAKIAALEKATTSERIHYVGEPTLTLFPAPKDKANGCAVLVCPGGGYNILAWPKEGLEIAEWLNTFGVTAAVLKYRVPRRDKDAPHKAPLQDAQRSLRLMRKNAAAWNLDPGRIGILGFSAGGHLTVMTGIQWDRPAYKALDDADQLSCRPDFLIPIYAAYLGDAEDPFKLNSLIRVTKRTPPTFMAVTYDDKHRGAHAALLLVELKKAGVPAELHVYVKGGHGYGMRPSANAVSQWPDRCAAWLSATGLLDAKK